MIAMGTNTILSADRARCAIRSGSAERVQPAGRHRHEIGQRDETTSTLADMAKRNLAKVYVPVTTLDRDLARALEPRARRRRAASVRIRR